MFRPSIYGGSVREDRRDQYNRGRIASGDSNATPLTIMGASTLEWWRADLGVTIGTGVSAWAGQVSATAFTQGVGASQPTYNATGGPNSQAIIQFDGADDSMAATLARSAPGTTPSVIWMVLRQDAWTSTEPLIQDQTSNSFTIRQVGASPALVQRNAGADANSNTGAPISTWVRAKAEFTNSTSDLLQLASTIVTGANAGNNAGSGPLLARNIGSTLFAAVSIAEIAFFTSIPTTGQNAQLNAYVTSRYGAGLT